jgi:hypothetical protein
MKTGGSLRVKTIDVDGSLSLNFSKNWNRRFSKIQGTAQHWFGSDCSETKRFFFLIIWVGRGTASLNSNGSLV